MMPETWLPTVTFFTALSWPLAVTVCVMSSRVTAVVLYSSGLSWDCFRYHCQAPMAAATIRTSNTHLEADERDRAFMGNGRSPVPNALGGGVELGKAAGESAWACCCVYAAELALVAC